MWYQVLMWVSYEITVGCGLAKGSKEKLAESIKGTRAAKRWRETDVLIIDESPSYRLTGARQPQRS